MERKFQKRSEVLESQFANKQKQIDKQVAELEQRRLELNDREPQHERRRLREILTDRLQSTISQPLKLSSDKEVKANWNYIFAGGIFFVISVYLSLILDNSVQGALFWTHVGKSFIFGVAGAAFIWSGLAGLKATAVAARNYERAIQRYAFDMDRASWIVETILQMNALEKSAVPDQWLESVCRDLFALTESRREEPRSLDALAALLDVTAKAKLGSSGLDFEIDRKGARRLTAEHNTNN